MEPEKRQRSVSAQGRVYRKKEEVPLSRRIKERGCGNHSEAAAQRQETRTRCTETQTVTILTGKARGREEK